MNADFAEFISGAMYLTTLLVTGFRVRPFGSSRNDTWEEPQYAR